MYFRDILLACMLACAVRAGKTGGKPANNKPAAKPAGKPADIPANPPNNAVSDATTLSPDATAADLKKFKCANLTAKQLNSLKDCKACAGLTASCLKEFDVTNLDHTCWEYVPLSEWKHLTSETAEQLIKGPINTLTLTPAQFSAILPRLDLAKIPAPVITLVASDTSLLDVVLDKGDGKTIATFVTADSLPLISLGTFARFSKSFVATLNDDVFTDVSAAQLNMMPKEAFGGFNAKQWRVVKPTALAGLARPQAENLSDDCWNNMTNEQLQAFGPSLDALKSLSAVKAPSAIVGKRQYKANHPCQAVEARRKKLDEKIAKGLDERCKDVLALNVNSAIMLAVSSLTFTSLFLVAGLLLTL